MAGIGFVLRKLARQDNILGTVQAYAHSALASTGPWLFTIFAIGGIMLVAGQFTTLDEMFDFRIIIIYNFSFSLVFSGPIFMVATRYLADSIYEDDVTSAPGMLLGALMIAYAVQIPIVAVFYFFITDFELKIQLSAITNYAVVTAIWLVTVFMTALKDYKTITSSFAFGVLVSLVGCAFFGSYFGTSGLLNGFSLGLVIVVGSLVSRVLAEYPYPYVPFTFSQYFKKYWQLAFSGFVYNAAAWVDKWIMWFSPEREIRHNMIYYPDYDSAMFLAYLTIVPSMAMFVLSIETNFFEKYIKYYKDIDRKCTYHLIRENHFDIVKSIFDNSRSFIVFQGTLCLLFLLSAPMILEAFSIPMSQLYMFRFGTLGALFHVQTLFLTIILSYFDNRKATLYIYLMFLVTNAVFTLITLQLGFEYYGAGYFLSAVCTFIAAGVIVINYVRRLPYHTFVTSNSSVRV